MKNILLRDPLAVDASGQIIEAINQLGTAHKAQIAEVKTAVEEVEKKAGDQVKAVKDEFDKFIEQQKENEAKRNTKFGSEKKEEKSFNQIIGETIENNIEEIKSLPKNLGGKNFRLAGYEDDKIKEVKAVGDMSTSANFAGASNFITDVRNQIIESPYNRVWLSDILPGGSSSQSNSVLYPKENGGEGAAALWTDPTADKAQMDFDLTTQQSFFKWIAGIVIVGREMLDDIPFMTSYIQARMLRSLKKAENSFILDGSADTNPVSGLNDLATAYDGALTVPVERIIDASWGQIVEDTENFYNPTDILLTPRNAVSIGLNKSGGSGEYDLPPGSVGYVNGQLTIGGINTVKTNEIGAGNFMVFDRNSLMFIRRMAPELRVFEDATLAKKNKIMFRIEERATLIGFNNNAIVKGTLSAV